MLSQVSTSNISIVLSNVVPVEMCSLALILSLPNALSTNILAEWLPVKSVAFLDSAVCNRSTRDEFLSLLRDPGCVLKKNHASCIVKSNNYMALRGAKVSRLHIQHEIGLDVLQKVLQTSANTIDDLTIEDLQSDTLPALYMVDTHCRRLSTIILRNIVVDSSFRNILQNNFNLSILFLVNVSGLDTTLLADVHLPNLGALCLKGKQFDDKIVCALLRTSDGKLLYVRLVGCSVGSAGVAAVADFCPQLRAVRIITTEQIGSALVNVSEKCRFLCNLELSGVRWLDLDFRMMMANLLQLRTLRMKRNRNLSDDDFVILGQVHGDGLTHLCFQDCQGYTEIGLCCLVKLCTVLTELSICTDFTHVTPLLIELIPHSLRVLYISAFCSVEVKDAICQHGKHLTKLGLCCSLADTVQQFQRILRECSCLEELLLMYFPPDSLEDLRTVNRKVNVTVVDAFG